jgi:hypothetical protein
MLQFLIVSQSFDQGAKIPRGKIIITKLRSQRLCLSDAALKSRQI